MDQIFVSTRCGAMTGFAFYSSSTKCTDRYNFFNMLRLLLKYNFHTIHSTSACRHYVYLCRYCDTAIATACWMCYKLIRLPERRQGQRINT